VHTSLSIKATPKGQLRRLYGFMAAREFVASLGELVAAGFSASQIKNWLRSGRLVRVAHSVYSYGRDVQTSEALRRVALLVAGPGSAIAGRSACEAWGIVRERPGLAGLVQVGSPFGQVRELKGCSPALRDTTIRVVRRDLRPEDVRTKGGIRLARPAHALVDFSADASDPEVRFAFLEACHLRLFGRPDLRYSYERLAGRRGARKLRPYLGLWVPELNRIKSVYEGWYLLVWIERGHPMPLVNERVFGREIDLFFPGKKFGLELDGGQFHSDPAQKEVDREKMLFLESRGLTMERLPYKVFAADPIGEVDRIARQLGFC